MIQNQASYGIPPPGYRLPAETRIGCVRLQVGDLQRSIDYYTGVLGLRVLEAARGEATLGAHDERTLLVALRERKGVRPVPRRGLLGLYHFALLLPDRAALGGFVRHLAALGVQAGSADHAVSESIYLTDPDGLGIEVYADRPRSTWRINGQELYMTTQPLDLRDVAGTGADKPWIGMPSGTVVGHVHLFVRGLEAAASFYHAALGFDKVVWSYPGALFLSAGGYHHHLGTNIWAVGAPAATGDDARLAEWELILPHTDAVERAARSVTDAGFPIERGGGDRVTRDPWGTTLRIRTPDARHF